ncbi:IS701 family transposase (plasmid) [Phormidium sp. CLA17]|uniref:IS701 family transposase n=1 Tax=Leptolyngbya sp. Cla-17 TaxID=2803751 RepID=UPI001492EF21|nr:IS701 family transposase [Leptolyngbya sp. Cla-17]MBM0745173.1 IS701 family transposase [Leptolyngbya sp. Cla-17]
MPASRVARPTIRFVDEYCQLYEGLFPEVRSFEAFKLLHLGMISEIKRKSLPAIAKVVGLDNQQNLHHFLSESPWQMHQLRQKRLELTLKVLNGRSLILLIDETGDCKKGKSTDYVKRQYIGNVGKKENGIVAVTAYGLVNGMIVPLSFEVYKPKERLKEGEEYQSKPQIAARMIRQLQALGFQFELVLADSLYGESKVNFVDVLDELKLPYILAIRSNHALWLPQDQEVYQEPWQTFKRTFSNGTTETRYRAEVIYGKRHRKQYWLLTTDPETLPDNSTSFVMVCAPAVNLGEIGDSYGFRTWIEYGLKQAKDALGWADFRMTRYEQIEKWWELVMSAFLMVSLFADPFNDSCPLAHQQFVQHPWWNNQSGWKNLLNNLRLIIQPLVCFNWLKHWLTVFPIASLQLGFEQLTQKMNQFICPRVHQLNLQLIFSSA